MGNVFYIGSIFCAFVSIYLIIFKSKNSHSFSNTILICLFISYIYCAFGFLIISSKLILFAPYLYRTSAPFNYLVPPLGYLYVRSVLYNTNKIKKLEFLHFIPFLLVVINYIPLYILPFHEKLIIVQNVIKDYKYNFIHKDGLLSENFQIFRPIQSIIYLYFQWKLIQKFKRIEFNEKFKNHYLNISKWLTRFTIAISFTVFVFVSTIIGILLSSYFTTNFDYLIFITSIPLAISLFYLTFYVIVNIDLYIGMPNLIYEDKSSKCVNESDYTQELTILIKYFEQKQPFLMQNLKIGDVSTELNIHPKLVSFLLNQFYDQNFNDFVNSYRIQYVIEMMKNGELKDFTLHGLGSKAGFANKTSFINAFKKSQNCTPTQYIFNNQLKK